MVDIDSSVKMLEAIERLYITVEGKDSHDHECLKEWCAENIGVKYLDWGCVPDTKPTRRMNQSMPITWFFRTPESAAEFSLTWS